ncbi:MAG TPA: hypothetical protein VHM26_04675 [Chitinophagaceae bacterium]|nr:hypothetical protein [Chitinophagaceae bacterium]
MIFLGFAIPLLFLGFWMVASYMMRSEGWHDLMQRYGYKKIFTGERAGLVSIVVNESRYKKSFTLSYNQEGFYLKPVFLLLFHKPVFIPWREAKAIFDKNVGVMRCTVLSVGNPQVATIALHKSVYEAMKAMVGSELV